MGNAAKEREMIIGTEGNKDYLVIAEQDGFILGLKPLLLIGMDQAQYGFRLRMQEAENDKPDIENKQAKLDKMQAVFTGVPWSKRSSTRFSTVLLAEVSYGIEFLDKVKEEAVNGYGKLVDTIAEGIAPVEISDPVDLVNFVTERYEEMIEEVRKAYAEYQSGKSGKGKKASEAADVLSFPTSGDDIE